MSTWKTLAGLSFAFSKSNSPGKSLQSQMPKPPTKLTFNTDRILWKWVRHGTWLRGARDVGRMQTQASIDGAQQQVQWQTPQRHGSAGVGGGKQEGLSGRHTPGQGWKQMLSGWESPAWKRGWATEGTGGPICAVTASMWGGCRGRWDWSGGQRLAHFPEPGHPELCSEDQCVLQGATLSTRGKPGFNFQRLVFKFIFFSGTHDGFWNVKNQTHASFKWVKSGLLWSQNLLPQL